MDNIKASKKIFSIEDAKKLSKKRLPKIVYDFIDGASGDEKLSEINSFDLEANYYGLPDGATVDNQNNYWSARVRGGCVISISGTGEVRDKVDTPSKTPTCLTFGGENLDHIYVTSLKESTSNNKNDGNLFIFKTNIKGNHQILSSI